MTSILVGIPTRGSVRTETLQAMWKMAQSFARSHISLYLATNEHHALELARAELARCCIEERCDALLMVDSDVAFEPSALHAMLETELDVVSLAYRERRPRSENSVTPVMGHALARPRVVGGHRVVEVEVVGAGALLVRRRVLETLIDRHPELTISLTGGGTSYHLFRTMIARRRSDGTRHLLGEDFAFNLRCRAAGYPIHVMLDIETSHAGQRFRLGDHASEIPPPIEPQWLPESEPAEIVQNDKPRLRRHDSAPPRARKAVRA